MTFVDCAMINKMLTCKGWHVCVEECWNGKVCRVCDGQKIMWCSNETRSLPSDTEMVKSMKIKARRKKACGIKLRQHHFFGCSSFPACRWSCDHQLLKLCKCMKINLMVMWKLRTKDPRRRRMTNWYALTVKQVVRM